MSSAEYESVLSDIEYKTNNGTLSHLGLRLLWKQ